MEALLQSDGQETPLQVFDRSFYETQLRKTEFGVDPMVVAAYFPLQQVLDGMLEITGEVFGVEYRKVDTPVWHPDVLTYAIHDRESRDLISHFHMDLFPREGKFSHAAAFPLVSGRRLPDGSYQRPLSAIVANFTKPGSDRPVRCSAQRGGTFFHEFGPSSTRP